jgi:hypothetical protein
MAEELYPRDFPRIRCERWVKTSYPDASYNCIAFAVGDTNRHWWPNKYFPEDSDDYWPYPDGPHELTIEAFVLAFRTCGYAPCGDGRFEVGFQKIALYALGTIPKHAALQQPNGKWRSKLGTAEDIETTIEGLAGPLYGEAVLFLKRENRDFCSNPEPRSPITRLLQNVTHVIKSLLAYPFSHSSR